MKRSGTTGLRSLSPTYQQIYVRVRSGAVEVYATLEKSVKLAVPYEERLVDRICDQLQT